MSDSPKLDLPEISESQSGKATTHNEALRILDALVQCNVKDKDLATPPGSPADGDTYVVAGSPTGAWSGHATHIAYYKATSWIFAIPVEGWTAYVQDENGTYLFNGSAWVAGADILATSYDVGGGYGGTIPASSEILRIPMVRAVNFPNDMSGSRGSAGTPGSVGSAVFSIRKNGTQFATMTFGVGASTSTFATGSDDEDFAIGDVLTIISPNPANAALADIGFTLKATKI